MIATVTMLTASCSDYDDWNTANSASTNDSKQTLWENISNREELSDFAELLARVGYDKELQTNRFYTVWAPVNGTYNADSLKTQVDSVNLLKKFVKNHIADFNYTLTGGVEAKRVYTLNAKSYELTNEGGNTYDGIHIQTANLPSSNGVLHTLGGMAQFYPNLYEYLSEVQDADSISSYIKRYETLTLDLKNSIEGPIDSLGRQTYSDSVMILSNSMTRRLGVKLDNEDSTYTMLFPTDEAYKEIYEKIATYFKYPTTLNYSTISTTGLSNTKTTVDPLLTDSLTRLNLASALTFSHSDVYNQWLDGKDKLYQDTLRATSGLKLSNGEEMLNEHLVGGVIPMSNGHARLVDSLAYHPWDTWCGDISVNVYNKNSRPYVNSGAFATYTLQLEKQSIRYADMIPSNTTSSQPYTYFLLPNVRSTAYNVYLVSIPSTWISESDTLDVKFEAAINYADASGTIKKVELGDKFIAKAKTEGTYQLDSILLGSITFPVAYAGVGDDCAPNLYVKINRPRADRSKYSNRLRVVGIVLRPVEYDNFQPFITNREQ